MSVKELAFKEQKKLRYELEMCEWYLNSSLKWYTNKQYYERARKRTLKDLINLQLKEFDRT